VECRALRLVLARGKGAPVISLGFWPWCSVSEVDDLDATIFLPPAFGGVAGEEVGLTKTLGYHPVLLNVSVLRKIVNYTLGALFGEFLVVIGTATASV